VSAPHILGLVSALVAAITIFIVTYIDLVNRRKQIGIERAIGVRGGAIVSSYCLKALAYAVVAIALGLLLFKGRWCRWWPATPSISPTARSPWPRATT
jgi:ABC-type antimicrobial peptide transport system permease subunit